MRVSVSIVDPVIRENTNWKGNHPAEIAARHISKREPTVIGGSDEQIVKDLRKLVFAVPMMEQDELLRNFFRMDGMLIPVVHSLIEHSEKIFDEVIQIVIKVAAGNTYGKNIYEKEDLTEDQKSDKKPRTTYKPHEVSFLENSYDLLRLAGLKDRSGAGDAMEKANFIRGVYEELLQLVIDKTVDYESLHWKAINFKFAGDLDRYYRCVELINHIEKEFRISNTCAFDLIRRSHYVHQKCQEIRAMVIAPYLRAVYKKANSMARNPHQMLDNFQNGSIGLFKAASCYSTKRPASFSSVAKWWIKQMMLLSIKEDANFVKLPIATWQLYTKLEKIRIAENIGAEEFTEIAKAAKLPLDKVKSVYDSVKLSQVYSLNKTYDHNEKLTLEDIIPDYEEDEDDIFKDDLRKFCQTADLTDTERKVLALQYGMLDIIPSRKIDETKILLESLNQNLQRIGFCITFNT